LIVGLFLPALFKFLLDFALRMFLGNGFWYSYSPPAPVTVSHPLSATVLRLLLSNSIVILFQLLIAARLGWRLRHDMERRNFSFSRTIA
jgi:hypothetical protein